MAISLADHHDHRTQLESQSEATFRTAHIKSAIDCLPFTDEGYERAMKYLKEKYGHPSEIAGSYVTSIIELPFITERDVPKIHRFYERGKLDTIEGVIYYIVKKLDVVKVELVAHVETNWRDWTFRDLLDALQKWTEVNSIAKVQKRSKDNSFHNQNYQSTGGRALTSRDSEVKCIYCESVEHKAISCDKVTNTNERKKILVEKHLCFYCAVGQHAASNCIKKQSFVPKMPETSSHFHMSVIARSRINSHKAERNSRASCGDCTD